MTFSYLYFITLFIGIIGYLTYFIFYSSKFLKSKISLIFPKNKDSFYWLQLTRIVGFISMALLPMLWIKLIDLDFWEIDFSWTQNDFYFTILITSILIPLGSLNAKGKEHLKMYPQVRMKKWSITEYLMNILSWGIYLLGYEFLFRGVLFLGLIPLTGLYTAILINTCLYTLAHLHKGKKEMIGSIPLGIILCFITAHTDTIWTAFAIHWIMASNNFIWSHYFQKNIK